ncbi:hypothetical protein GCM10010840_27630 [Deinococcus aerolatus]|uniref:Bacterial transcriptional activator domain-containing protein n=1 Tax=Deinococcus aerolatus TaxID=522487 RepID=A0ABQ2GDH8_9DEIO|nr:AAA family ATPase [Deinococcus aerolatus]GGL88065.1 hypothetical protein GCM10010840_27630 [Deinococcus aerolatus]
MSPTRSWHAEVLGVPRLFGESAGGALLDRKTSALIAYLALEGPTSRAQLAALLWPESAEAIARNNLAQALRKLRLARQPGLVMGRHTLQLAEGVRVDARGVREMYEQGRLEAFVTGYGALLAPFDFDDCAEFEDWLIAERERWQAWQRAALRSLALDADGTGDPGGALEWARQLLAADAASEEAYVLVARFQFAVGDRTAALGTLRACEAMLEREFGVNPNAQTRALARLIREGSGEAPRPPTAQRAIPLTVLRPPILVGREREWALMEQAWANGQGVCLVGEAGVGKSRLVQEFARAHGGDFYLDCRPGDEKVLYGLTTRMLRRILGRYPQLKFEPWVTLQLARLLPEFGSAPPMVAPADKVRFYQAITEVVRRAVEAGMTVFAYDDTHYFDDGSAEAQLFMWGALGWGDIDAPFRIVFNLRPQAYTSVAGQALADLVRTGRVLVMELGPLTPDAVERLVESISVPELTALTPALQRYTGGNPQFLLETVKYMIETGDLERGFPDRLPPPGPVREIVSRRLKRLSPAALHAAQAAAVLQSDFTVELITEVLRAPLLDVLSAWQELERAQVVTECRFSHDLVYETVEAQVAPGVREALNRSAARVLEGHRFPPSRVGRHWLQGGEPVRAAVKFQEASDLARGSLRFVEAADLLEEAAALFERHGDPDRAFSTRHLLTRDLLKEFDLGQRYEASLGRLFSLARTEGQQARAWHCQGLLHSRCAHHGPALEAAQTGWMHAEQSGDAEVQAELSQFLGIAALHVNQLDAAAAAFRQAAALNEELGRVSGQLSALQNLGVVLGKLGRYAEAVGHLTALVELGTRAERPVSVLNARTNLAVALSRLGAKRDAREHVLAVLTQLDLTQGREMNRVLALITLGGIERDLGHFAGALEALERAAEVSEGYQRFAWALIRQQQATVHAVLGDFETARSAAEQALGAAKDALERAEALRVLALVRASLGEEIHAELRELAELRRGLGPEDVLRVDLTLARLGLLDVGALEALLGHLRAGEAHDLLIVALTLHAQHLLDAGRPAPAAASAREAVELLRAYAPAEVSRDQLLALHARILSATGHPDAAAVGRQAADALAAAMPHVPPELQSVYRAAR